MIWGEKESSEERSKIEPVLNELKTLIKGDNKELIEAKTKELSELAGKISEQAYAQQGGDAGTAHEQPQTEAKKDDAVVDAEFEEVKDKDDKK